MSKKFNTIKQLIFDDKNFNKGTQYGKSLMEKSLSKFGAGRSILIDKNNRIIAGNKTTKNFAELGLEKVTIVDVSGDTLVAVRRNDIDLDTPEGREFALADNQTAKVNIDFDFGTLEAEIDEGVLEDWGIEIPEEEVLEAEEDDFDTTPPEIPITVLGDLYEIGEHRLLCGDSTCSDSVAKLMNGEKFDLIVTDPPYNVAYVGKTKEALTIQNDKISDEDFKLFLYNHFVSIGLFTKNGGVFYIFQPDKQIHNFVNAFIDAGNKYSGLLIWNKDSMVISQGDYHSKHETIIYGWKEGSAHNWNSDRKQVSVLDFARPKRNQEHPTMKPIELLSYLIKNNTKSKELVGDGFLGSGSTMVASHQLKRKCYGMELDPKYCDVIVNRMLKLDPSLPLKRNGVLINIKEFEAA